MQMQCQNKGLNQEEVPRNGRKIDRSRSRYSPSAKNSQTMTGTNPSNPMDPINPNSTNPSNPS